MSFQLSPEVDKNKIFLVNLSELEGRLDPVMALYQRRISGLKYKTKTLGELLESSPQYGANEIGIARQSLDEPRYIRITDIDGYGLLKYGIGKTAETVEPQYMLKNNDLLFARSGSVGRTYLHKIKGVECPCFYAGYMIRFVIRKNEVNPDYIFFYTQLEIYKEWVNSIQRTDAQPNINAEEYKSLKIPIPPKEIQTQIVAKMDAAYVAKKQKEAEAQQLLDGIDDYLLGELGIELPAQAENTLQSRIFTRQLSEVSGGRFDPLFNMPLFAQIETNINNGKFNCKYLDELVFPVSGVTYKATDERKCGHAILRSNNVNLDTNELNFNKIRFIDSKLNISSLLKLYKNDILMSSASGSKEHVGKVALIENDINYYFGAFMLVLRKINLEYSGYYLFSFLSSKLYRKMLFRFLGGTNINNVGFEKIKKFLIPLPPLEKQTEIANHITATRNQAKELQKQAKTGLEQAKKEVEAMILGEDDSTKQ